MTQIIRRMTRKKSKWLSEFLSQKHFRSIRCIFNNNFRAIRVPNLRHPLLSLQMHILVCAATEAEIAPTKKFVWEQRIGNKVQFLKTGVGVTAATYSITREVCNLKPSIILQAGVAGSFDEKLALGTTVVIRNETLADLGVFQNKKFNSVFDLGLEDRNRFPWKDGKLHNLHAHTVATDLPLVDSITVNEITTSTERIIHYKIRLGAVLESMEGAALHYVGLMEAVPFLQIRSVSNYIGERDKSKWLLAKAINNVNTELQKLLKKILSA